MRAKEHPRFPLRPSYFPAFAHLLFPLLLWTTTCAAQTARASQFLLVNRTPGPVSLESFQEVRRALPDVPDSKIRVGIGFIFSYFQTRDDASLLASLRGTLQWSQETDTPVLIQLDGEQWWQGRPDLWNWWDPSRPGFDPANRENVEWSGWTPEHALKIAWRNWGRQLRVLPPPNLMSPRYRKACHEKMALLIPVVLDWWKALPVEKKDLLVGVKVGWESSIGVNAWYYPNGNALLDRPAGEDPTSGLNGEMPPARGVAPIGYAAVKTAGLRDSGELTEADLAEIARLHLEDLSREAARLGVPRDRLFTHSAGWKDGELLYRAAVNRFSCPGWSFYRHAGDPRQDIGVQEALKPSDAPWWAATEWLYPGPRETQAWRRALENTLADELLSLSVHLQLGGHPRQRAGSGGHPSDGRRRRQSAAIRSGRTPSFVSGCRSRETHDDQDDGVWDMPMNRTPLLLWMTLAAARARSDAVPYIERAK